MKVTFIIMKDNDSNYKKCQEQLQKYKWKNFDNGTLNNNYIRYAILNEENSLIGFYQLIEMQDPWEDKASCELYKLFIFPQYRKKGYGLLVAGKLIEKIYQEYNEFYIEILDETQDFWCKSIGHFIEEKYECSNNFRVQGGTRCIFRKRLHEDIKI
ncbi:hypothetical protein BKK54_03295 [Rodentibacter genomosp. 1]|uniref:N-acetyltransferase domain-containing protein n=1 Tax=Rodentibacter genomosp. 1 TaxID=1908264 RepID=A0A1V3J7Q0_9PAST|nr:GNAT family N-acetyltransferase [Rodentibacter genomosp. 1]OOF51325.1 hypothetical protein BKK54_03295 [Rodentibacter genomosp. 1]